MQYAACKSMCQFSASIPENRASLNGPYLFFGSVVTIVVLSKSNFCPLWVVVCH